MTIFSSDYASGRRDNLYQTTFVKYSAINLNHLDYYFASRKSLICSGFFALGKQSFATALQMCFTRCKTERETSQIDADSFSVFEIYRNDVGPINLFTPRNWDFSSLSEASKFYLCVTRYQWYFLFRLYNLCQISL